VNARAGSNSRKFCVLPRNFVGSFPYNVLKPVGLFLGGNDRGGNTLASEQAITRAKQVAQECAMKTAYYRRAFTQQARRESIVATLLLGLGLVLFLRAPLAGFFLFLCGAVAAHQAYTSFKHACTTYGEYGELHEDHD
jgi:hypothetical protein